MKASALLYAVGVSIVMLLIVSMMVAFVFDGQKFYIRYKNIERINDNVISAENVILHSSLSLNYNEVASIDLFEDGKDIVSVTKKQWGLMDIYTIVSKIGSDSIVKSIFTGNEADFSYSLQVTNTNRVLNVTKDVRIDGDIYCPDGILKMAYINTGSGFTAKTPIGQVIHSGIKSNTDNLLKNVSAKIKSISSISPTINLESIRTDSFFYSFSSPTQIYSSTGTIHLDGSSPFSGNVIIKSSSRIIVSSSAKLSDVVLIAPEIIIENKFDGQLQCFATEKLIVGENVNLRYPTALVLEGSEKTDSVAQLAIGEKTIIAGQILSLGKNKQSRPTVINIGDKVNIYGQILSSGNIQLRGELYGNVSAGAFFLKNSSAYYENTLQSIDIYGKNPFNAFLSLMSSDEKTSVKKIIKVL